MQSFDMPTRFFSVYLVFVANALAQPYHLVDTTKAYTKNVDGSISQNAGLGGYDYASQCTNTFTITPNPVQVYEGNTATVTFNVGALGGGHVYDTGSLVPATLVLNTAFNIHSGGFVQWILNGPQDPFATGTKPGVPFSRLTSEVQNGQVQTKTSPVYATAGCQILTATMQGDFKHNAQDGSYTGSYRCNIQRAIIVQVALPLTTLECPDSLLPSYYFTPMGGEDLTAVIQKIYAKHATTPGQRAALYKDVIDLNKDVIKDPHHLPAKKKLRLPPPP